MFCDRAHQKGAKERIVTREEVIGADPEVMMFSWCGKAFDRASVEKREGFSAVSAIRHGRLYEIDSTIILQPGPACLTDGLASLEAILRPLASAQNTL